MEEHRKPMMISVSVIITIISVLAMIHGYTIWVSDTLPLMVKIVMINVYIIAMGASWYAVWRT